MSKSRAILFPMVALVILMRILPSTLIRIFYGNYPIGSPPHKSLQGLTQEEVTALLGTPHERYAKKGDFPEAVLAASTIGMLASPEGCLIAATGTFPGRCEPLETWFYYCDSFGFAIFGIKFGFDGRVASDWW